MSKWHDAVRVGKRVSARWGYPHDLSSVHLEGKAIAYSDKPMVLIETPDGGKTWWACQLTFIEGDDQ